MSTEAEILRDALDKKTAELVAIKLELIDNRIETLTKNDKDKEDRLRIVETSRVRFETLVWLAVGGGALSLINLITELVKKI